MLHPIWKDYQVNLGNVESAEYVIGYMASGSFITIYHGKAHRKPDETSVQICINDICADWLVTTFPSLIDGFDRQELPVEFIVQTISATGIYTEVARARFINDWSYDVNHDAERDGLAAPVNGHIDIRQWLLWTGIDVSEVDAKVTLVDGNTFNVIIPVKISSDFNSDYNVDFSKSVKSAGSGTAVLSPAQWGNAVKVSIKGKDYHIVNGCSRYVLYYRNSFGGWDSLLIEGAASMQDNLTRHSMDKVGAYGRTKTNYLTEIQKKLTLHTSWLSDEQSLNMHHLLNSPDVYLHDLEINEIIPVILDNTSTPYKTYKGEGRKLVNYKIDVSVAQSRIRR